MLKLLAQNVWVYDVEWAPDPDVGRLVYGLPASMSAVDVIAEMYKRARTDKDKPDSRPYLKTSLCRVVSIAVLQRRTNTDLSSGVQFDLRALTAGDSPNATEHGLDEHDILEKFLHGIGRQRPQLVGFNCREADLPVLLQRACAHRLYQPQFAKRPNKPWEGSDYFIKHGEWHVDLKDMIGGFGKATPSLHEICVACGIPGKFSGSGDDVLDLWLADKTETLGEYNQLDVLSTYELFMRVVLFAGFITPDQYMIERVAFVEFLERIAGVHSVNHLRRYLAESERLRVALPRLGPIQPALELTPV